MSTMPPLVFTTPASLDNFMRCGSQSPMSPGALSPQYAGAMAERPSLGSTSTYYRKSSGSIKRLRDLVDMPPTMTDVVAGPSKRRSPNPKITHTNKGLSAMCILTHDEELTFTYASVSMVDILGYETEEMVGMSARSFWHPEDVADLGVQLRGDLEDKPFSKNIELRLRHRDGHYITCTIRYYMAHNNMLATYELSPSETRRPDITMTPPEPHVQLRRSFSRTRWSPSASSFSSDRYSSRSPPSIGSQLSYERGSGTGSDEKHQPRRTFFLIDRFTDTSRIMLTNNDAIIRSSRLKDQSLYSIIKPSDRLLVRRCIDKTKESCPIDVGNLPNEPLRCFFSVAKIPDFPPAGHIYPQGTDETERFMPGQEYIPVEGIFTATSDGLALIIARAAA